MSALELTPETENERIERWRYEALVRAGYEPSAARRIASRLDIDLHHAVDLIERGCDAELALAILL